MFPHVCAQSTHHNNPLRWFSRISPWGATNRHPSISFPAPICMSGMIIRRLEYKLHAIKWNKIYWAYRAGARTSATCVCDARCAWCTCALFVFSSLFCCVWCSCAANDADTGYLHPFWVLLCCASCAPVGDITRSHNTHTHSHTPNDKKMTDAK